MIIRNKMRKGIYIFSLFILVFLTWYLCIKTSDYTINFKSNTFPETINQSIKLWNNGLDYSLGLKDVDNFKHVEQVLKVSDSIHTYDWHITPINDSTSKVSIGIKDKNVRKSLMNRIQVPFMQTDFSKGADERILNFMTILKEHVDNFKITIIGIEEMPAKSLAYISIQKAQVEKAKGMMENSTLIGQVLLENKIALDGPPMLEITYWDRKKDSITYNFGYPIAPNQKVPSNTELQFKKLKSRKGIKAIYNGNYITSDRAWYALVHYAEKNKLKVENLPVEIFYNNPDMGGNSLSWKTEVYLPLKEGN